MSPEILAALISQDAIGIPGPAPTIYVDDVFCTHVRVGTGTSTAFPSKLDLSAGNYAVLTKKRNASGAPSLYDSVRGFNKELQTSNTTAETTQTEGLTAASSSTYTYGTRSTVNASGDDYVDWIFREADDFFKVTTATLSGADVSVDLSSLGTIGMAAVKRTDGTGDWHVWHRSIGASLCLLDAVRTSPGLTLSGGNLTATYSGGGGVWQSSMATVGVSAGKWYWEVTISGNIGLGIAQSTKAFDAGHNYLGVDAVSAGWYTNYAIPPDTYPGTGGIINVPNYAPEFTTGTIGCKLDMDAGTMEFIDPSGTPLGVAFSNIIGTYYPAITILNPSESCTLNFGGTAFAHTLPSGYLPIGGSAEGLLLNTTDGKASIGSLDRSGTNLILKTAVLPNGNYSVLAWAHDTTATSRIQCGSYSGNGSDQTINVGKETQFLLVKQISASGSSWLIYDTARGLNASVNPYVAFPNDAGAEYYSNNDLNAHPEVSGFSVGFGVGDGSPINKSGEQYVYLAIVRPDKVPTVGTDVLHTYAYNSETAGTVVNTSFTPDVQFAAPRASGNIEVIDRLRGVNTATSTVVKPYLNTDNTSLEATSNNKTRMWTQRSYQVPTYWAGGSAVHWTLRRAKEFLEQVCWKVTGAVGSTQTWNPSDKNSNITLSNGNLTATASIGQHSIARATVGKTTGKWYWEVTLNVTGGNSPGIGVANAGASIADGSYLGVNTDSWSYYAFLQAIYHSSTSPYGSVATAGDVIGVKLDLDAGTLEFLKNNVSQGIAFGSGVTGMLYPAVNLFSAGDQATANFGATAFTYPVPSGYSGFSSTRRVDHGLGVIPEFALFKLRSGSGDGKWIAYFAPLGKDYYLVLDTDAAKVFSQDVFGAYIPTTTDIGISETLIWNVNDKIVTYLMATLAGVSKIGSYTGNGSTQTIDCAFNGGARLAIVKRTDSTGDWYIWDTTRGVVSGNDPHLSFNSTAAEVTTDDSIDPHSAGFTVNQNVDTNINVASAEYVFIAIA